MTITEEQKSKIIELYQKGVSKKDIQKLEMVSYPSIRNILNENDINDKPERLQEKAEKTEKTLSEIFEYENCTEEAVLDLIYNLRRIAKESGSELGDFIEDIEFIFNKYHKITENPVKLFNFLLDISENLSLIYDNIEPETFLEIVELYYDKGLQIREVDEYMIENDAKAERILKNVKEELDKYQDKINNAQIELQKLTSSKAIWTAKLLEEPNKEKLQKAIKENNELQNLAQLITEKAQMLNSENQELKKMLEKTDKEKLYWKR